MIGDSILGFPFSVSRFPGFDASPACCLLLANRDAADYTARLSFRAEAGFNTSSKGLP
jgi:hypothetical protein